MRQDKVIPAVKRYGRQEFLESVWKYKLGEHLTILAPTQNGKTTFMGDLLKHRSPRKDENPPLVLVMKPRDPVVTDLTKRLEFKRIKQWPPLPSVWNPKPPGYVLWPPHKFDPEIDDIRLRDIMRRAILDCYRKGDRILVADETYGLINELKLHKDITAVHSRGSGMGLGIWCATQKPTHIGTWAYSQAVHLFLGYDPDENARKRFAEIGGVDPDIVKHYVMNLEQYEWFYIRRNDRSMCIIEGK